MRFEPLCARPGYRWLTDCEACASEEKYLKTDEEPCKVGHSVHLADVIHGGEKSSDGDEERDRSQKESFSAQPIVQLGKEKKLEDATQHLHRCQDGSDGGGIEAESSHVYWSSEIDGQHGAEGYVENGE